MCLLYDLYSVHGTMPLSLVPVQCTYCAVDTSPRVSATAVPTKKLKWKLPRPASEGIPSILGRKMLLKHATSAAADVLTVSRGRTVNGYTATHWAYGDSTYQSCCV
jgi:hypothetical protein